MAPPFSVRTEKGWDSGWPMGHAHWNVGFISSEHEVQPPGEPDLWPLWWQETWEKGAEGTLRRGCALTTHGGACVAEAGPGPWGTWHP